MNRTIRDIACPYCSQTFDRTLDVDKVRHLILCPIEEGGCDRYFVLRISCKVEMNTQKIVGE
jgi:hypothetical protein